MKHSIFGLVFFCLFALRVFAAPSVGTTAPLFVAKTQVGKSFSLADRKGKGWTVLFFYPKAGTPGCTKQACAFRDSINAIRTHNAEVYGISADGIEDQAKFHKEHHLSFDLLADPKHEVISKYGAKMEDRDLAKRWTFILDPQLTIRWFDDRVDPVMDAKRVAEELAKMKSADSKKT